jgi:hypothetical protein
MTDAEGDRAFAIAAIAIEVVDAVLVLDAFQDFGIGDFRGLGDEDDEFVAAGLRDSVRVEDAPAQESRGIDQRAVARITALS